MINNCSRYKEESKLNEKNIIGIVFNKNSKDCNNPKDIFIHNWNIYVKNCKELWNLIHNSVFS